MAEYTGRIRWFSLLIFVFGLLLISRLYFLQIVEGEEYRDEADKQYIKSSLDYYDRGNIFFTNKNGEQVPAASLKGGNILSIRPDEIVDKEFTFNKLTEFVAIDRELFDKKAAKVGDPEERLMTKLEKSIAEKISNEKIPGVHLSQERWRFYPGGVSASHVLGFVAYDKKNQINGRYGLERFYEDTLGRNADASYTNFFAEVFSEFKRVISGDPIEGDLVLTIEPSVQAYLEEKLNEIRNTWSSDYTGGIIMDPVTGEIIAAAIAPSFDPNNVQKEKSVAVFQNKLVENVFEMGSIIKPLTMAAAIDSGVVTPESTYFDAGTIILNGRKISNYDLRSRGVVSMQEVLNQSLNTGVVFAMQKMGGESFSGYMKKYGFGQETGIDLPNEIHGLIDNLDSKVEVDLATAAFGQGIALTPIETVRALASLANGGLLPNPHIVRKINLKIGGSKTIVTNPSTQILKRDTVETITRMLVRVVDTSLLNGSVKLPRYSVAAKTGTAQVVVNGSYSDQQFLHSFFGYFPAFNSKFIIFLINMHPKGVKYASETLTHPFIDITKFLINYYEIPPDR